MAEPSNKGSSSWELLATNSDWIRRSPAMNNPASSSSELLIGCDSNMPIFSLGVNAMDSFELQHKTTENCGVSPASIDKDTLSRLVGSALENFITHSADSPGDRKKPTSSSSSSTSAASSPGRQHSTLSPLNDPPIPIDFTLKPDLNVPPPNWPLVDQSYGVHRHLPWHPLEGPEGLSELLAEVKRRYHPEFEIEEDKELAERTQEGINSQTDSQIGTFSISGGGVANMASELNSSQQHLPDVVCGAEQLKQLLLAPYDHNRPLHMIAHRVGPSLLLEGATKFEPENTTPNTTRNKALFAKLLYYSLWAQDGTPGNGETPVPATLTPNFDVLTSNMPQSCGALQQVQQDFQGHGERLDFADIAAESGGACSSTFRRSLQWGFRDLALLVGASTALVEDPAHPTRRLALKLTSQKEYISQLEALEWWLDCVLSNASGVALCYHDDGVVMGYRMIPIDSLPNLSKNSAFEPLAVQAHAANVLQWLRSATSKRSSHTENSEASSSFIVMKASGEQTLKLYNLSQLQAAAEAISKSSHSPLSTSRETAEPRSSLAHKVSPLLGPCDPGKDSSHKEHVLTTIGTNQTRLHLDDLDDLDDDPQVEDTSDNLTSSNDLMTSAFDQHVALLCFRMAQCLPDSDAETRRLLLRALSLLRPPRSFSLDSISSLENYDHGDTLALVRAAAHVQISQHYRAVCPLPESDQEALKHARSALSGLAIVCRSADATHRLLHLKATGAQDDQTKVLEFRANKKFVPLELNKQPITSAHTLITSILRLMCGYAGQSIREGQLSHAVQAIAVIQGALSLRRDVIPSGLLCFVPQNDATPQKGSEAALDGTVQELFAALATLECLCGDVCSALYRRFLSSLRTERTESDVLASLLHVLREIDTAIMGVNQALEADEHLSSATKRGKALPRQYDQILEQNRVPPQLNILQLRLGEVVIATKACRPPADENDLEKIRLVLCDNGEAAFAAAISLSEEAVALLNQGSHGAKGKKKNAGQPSQLRAPPGATSLKEIRRRAGTFSSLVANDLSARLFTSPFRESTKMEAAIACYERAATLFSEAGDGANASTMLLSIGKIRLKEAEQECQIEAAKSDWQTTSGDPRSVMPTALPISVRERSLCDQAIQVFLKAISLLEEIPSQIRADSNSSSSESVAQKLHEGRMNYINTNVVVGNRLLAPLSWNSPSLTPFKDPHLRTRVDQTYKSHFRDIGPAAELSAPADIEHFSIFTLQGVKWIEHVCAKRYLLVACKMASAATKAAADATDSTVVQRRIQTTVVEARCRVILADLHRKCAGLRAPHPQKTQEENRKEEKIDVLHDFCNQLAFSHLSSPSSEWLLQVVKSMRQSSPGQYADSLKYAATNYCRAAVVIPFYDGTMLAHSWLRFAAVDCYAGIADCFIASSDSDTAREACEKGLATLHELRPWVEQAIRGLIIEVPIRPGVELSKRSVQQSSIRFLTTVGPSLKGYFAQLLLLLLRLRGKHSATPQDTLGERLKQLYKIALEPVVAASTVTAIPSEILITSAGKTLNVQKQNWQDTLGALTSEEQVGIGAAVAACEVMLKLSDVLRVTEKKRK